MMASDAFRPSWVQRTVVLRGSGFNVSVRPPSALFEAWVLETIKKLPTMVQQPAHSIIAELEEAVRGGSSAKRVDTLRQGTDLFLHDGDRPSDAKAPGFDTR